MAASRLIRIYSHNVLPMECVCVRVYCFIMGISSCEFDGKIICQMRKMCHYGQKTDCIWYGSRFHPLIAERFLSRSLSLFFWRITFDRTAFHQIPFLVDIDSIHIEYIHLDCRELCHACVHFYQIHKYTSVHKNTVRPQFFVVAFVTFCLFRFVT